MDRVLCRYERGRHLKSGNTRVGCDDPDAHFDQANGTPNCEFPIASGALETNYSTGDADFIGGAQVGYNQQSGNIVFGIEADFSGTTVKGEDIEFKDVPPTSPGERTVTQELEWLGTLRLRAEFVTGDWLLYATGGLAYGEVEYGYKAIYPVGGAFAELSERRVEFGWTIGAGAEVSFGDWSIKGEYLDDDLGDAEFSTEFFSPIVVPRPAFFEPEFDNQGHIARIGINFRID